MAGQIPGHDAIYRWSTRAQCLGNLHEVPESAVEKRLAAMLGQRLATLREARGLTQEQVAHAAGISRNHYQLLESGWSVRKTKAPANPRLRTLIALSEVLGTTLPDLFVDEMPR
ncbi:MAG: helix-turn-helix transcriptional regulator [Nocardia sp.]|nr:helix-turn-helix transcriptional regulator [Nocardia sp.]